MSIGDRAAISHFLIELRARLLYSLVVFLIFLSVFLYFAPSLYTYLAQPLLAFLPQGHFIATDVFSPVFVPFKLALIAAMLMTMPYLLYQLWCFITPALYRYERRLAWPFLLMSIGLFYTGMAFAYFAIFPLLFRFLARMVPTGVALSPDMSQYLDLTSQLLFMFGLLFEIPMAMVLLVATNLITRERFIKMRSYAIVGAFVIGMLLAPPDVLSQTILALPVWLLYEMGIVLSRFVRVNVREDANQVLLKKKPMAHKR